MVIGVCMQKGGSGKTTIVLNLAIKLGLLGEKTFLIDTDSQQDSIFKFCENRAEKNHKLIFNTTKKKGAKSLRDEINSLKQDYNIVVDTGGHDNEEMRQTFLSADLIIVPTVPSFLDIDSLDKMIEIFQQSKIYNPNLKCLIVISRASPNPFLAKNIKELKEYISKNVEDLKLCENVLHEREAFKKSLGEGLGVLEYCKENDKSFIDFENFFNEMVEYANGNI